MTNKFFEDKFGDFRLRPHSYSLLNSDFPILERFRYKDALDFCEWRVALDLKRKDPIFLLHLNYCKGIIYFNMLTNDQYREGEDEWYTHSKCHISFGECQFISKLNTHNNYLQKVSHGLGILRYFLEKNGKESDGWIGTGLSYYMEAMEALENYGDRSCLLNSFLRHHSYNNETYDYIHHSMTHLENLTKRTAKEEFALCYAYFCLCDLFIEKEDSKNAKKYLNLTRQIIQKNKWKIDSEYWLTMRQAMIHLIQHQWEPWNDLIEKSRRHIKTTGEEEDFNLCLLRNTIIKILLQDPDQAKNKITKIPMVWERLGTNKSWVESICESIGI